MQLQILIFDNDNLWRNYNISGVNPIVSIIKDSKVSDFEVVEPENKKIWEELPKLNPAI